MPTVERASIEYLGQGFSVIPTRRRCKRPLVPWRDFQQRRPTETEIREWYRRWPGAGVAIVCGAVSGLVVVDGDPRNGDSLRVLAPQLPVTPTVESGGAGRHLYFAVTPGIRVPKVSGLLPGVDLQGEASCVMAPPSVHPSGRRYRWLPGLALSEIPLAPLPPIIRHLIALHRQPDVASVRPWVHRAGAGWTLQDALGRLAGVRRVRSGWVARCPAHHDREPSLSIAQGTGGRLLMHCFAGCSFGQIRAALEAARA